MRKFSSYLLVTLKGIAMGAADVIPGVSGGTIAFLTGIYQELIDSIRSINGTAVRMLLRLQLGRFWKHINGNFLLAVFAGILISVFSIARLMTYLMAHHPVPLWSFFFGLIIASAIFILREIERWKFSYILALAAGIGIGAAICLLSPSETPNGLWFIFLSGAIAICAMILPGISGSFILLLLGKYQYILGSLTELNIPVLAVFACGALVGIISFSHFLSWLLKRFYTATICILSGFMVGSLVKVWPWQHLLESGISRPVLPHHEALLPVNAGHIPEAVIFAALGIGIVFAIELVAQKMKKD